MSEAPDERRGADPPVEARPVNGYLLHEEIGSGGMSRVYRATRDDSGEEVAVKVMRIENMDPDFERRLRREPEVQKGLGHENIVRLIDWFRVRDEFFLVMEYVNGRSLGQIIYRESGPMPFERARVYMRQALRALNHLHSLGIIHRDIKPSNILVGRDDTVKLADFGIAKFAWQQGQTKTQKGLGTPEYMSPEQARGTQIDHRTDIYSLGITLFEMLTARKPFARGEETPMAYVEVIQSILTRPLPDPRTFQPGIPAGAVRMLSRATAKEPSERFQSASEFLGALEMVEENDFSPATVAIGDIPGTASSRAHIEPAAEPYDAGRDRYPHEVERERESGRGVLWAVLLLLLIGAGGFFGYRYYEANFAHQPVRALTAVEAMDISKRMASDYRTFSKDHNENGLASLFAEEGNHYFSLENASREDIERDTRKFFSNIEVTNQYDIQIRRARAVNDSTIDGEWIFTYERIKKDGAVLRGQTSDRIRMELIDDDWYLTRQTTNWAKRRNEPPPPPDEPEVIDVPQPSDTAAREQPRDQGGGGSSNPPLFPPPSDTARRERSGGFDRNRDQLGSPRSNGASTRSRAPSNRAPERIGPPEHSGGAR